MIPNPLRIDCGWAAFIDSVDAIVMGRRTFEAVCSFEGDWPYTKPVFVLSRRLTAVPNDWQDKAQFIQGTPAEVQIMLRKKGYNHLYIDGGLTIQGFLQHDLIDELIITTLPILLGGGVRLFAELSGRLKFEHTQTEIFLNALVQSHYKRK